MRIRQSVVYPAFTSRMNLRELFTAAAKIGFPAVELWGRGADFEEVVALAGGHGLKIVSMCGHGTLQDGLNRRENHERIEGELAASIEVAQKAGIPALICFSGNRREGLSDDEGAAITAEGLRRVARHAEEAGITLNLELLNSKKDHPGYQCDRTEWGLKVVRAVNSPQVKLLYDIYHMQIMEGDVIRTITENIQWIGHFHTAGVPGRHDLDDTQELNYRAICRAIAATDYRGYVGHEFWPRGDAVEALTQAYATCDQG